MLTYEGGCRSVITDDGRTDSRRWNLLEGVNSAQTQVDVAQPGKMSVWAFPLDIHYSTTSIHGWPKFQCEALPPWAAATHLSHGTAEAIPYLT